MTERLRRALASDPRPCPMEAITAYVRSLHGITS